MAERAMRVVDISLALGLAHGANLFPLSRSPSTHRGDDLLVWHPKLAQKPRCVLALVWVITGCERT
jgi:hypothetical protein